MQQSHKLKLPGGGNLERLQLLESLQSASNEKVKKKKGNRRQKKKTPTQQESRGHAAKKMVMFIFLLLFNFSAIQIAFQHNSCMTLPMDFFGMLPAGVLRGDSLACEALFQDVMLLAWSGGFLLSLQVSVWCLGW